MRKERLPGRFTRDKFDRADAEGPRLFLQRIRENDRER